MPELWCLRHLHSVPQGMYQNTGITWPQPVFHALFQCAEERHMQLHSVVLCPHGLVRLYPVFIV